MFIFDMTCLSHSLIRLGKVDLLTNLIKNANYSLSTQEATAF